MSCCAPPAVAVQKNVPALPADFNFPYQGGGPWFTCAADGEMKPRVAAKGLGGPDTPETTMPKLLAECAAKKGAKPALCVERPCPPLKDGKAPPPLPREQWQTWTLKSYHEDTRKAAKAFIKLGFQQFDTVNVWGFNSPEWFIAAAAGMYAAGKCGGIYPTDTPPTAGYKVVHSGGAIVALETKAHYDKVTAALNERGDCTRVKAFMSWAYDPPAGEMADIKGCGKVPFLSWKATLDLGAAESDTELDARLQATKPGHCAALIYTSGTTGDPKAVMVSHDNVIYVGHTIFKTIGKSCGIGTTAEEERILSYLPLSHIAGMAMDFSGQIQISALFPSNTVVFFARPYDLKVGTIKDRLSIAKPTAFLGVPLVWEKMADKIRAIGAASTGMKKTISTWAKGKCLEHARNICLGGDASGGHCLAARVMKAVKGAVGLDCCKYALTGAAPIRIDTVEYYGSLGIFINEVYGMSESTGVVTMSTDQAHQWGSCGWQMPGSEVKCFKVDPSDLNKKTECPAAPSLGATEDEFMGEICFRGRGIMNGYLSCKDMGEKHVAEIQKKTAETIDAAGWLHSGDKGLKTAAGMIKITGRYKELIIGEGGENIAPVPIEDSVKGLCDAVAECMMIGDQRKYNVALMTLKAVGANGENPGTDELDAAAKNVNPAVTKISQAMKDPKWIETITAALTATNSNSKIVPNNAFKIQKFCILPSNFSEENGELTPTKKLKRAIVEKKYQKMIDKMYSQEGVYIEYEEFN